MNRALLAVVAVLLGAVSVRAQDSVAPKEPQPIETAESEPAEPPPESTEEAPPSGEQPMVDIQRVLPPKPVKRAKPEATIVRRKQAEAKQSASPLPQAPPPAPKPAIPPPPPAPRFPAVPLTPVTPLNP